MLKKNEFIENKNKIIEKINSYFENKNEIIAVYLFGSLVRGNFNKRSDIDIALMLKDQDEIESFNYKLSIIRELENILDIDVDVVIFSQVSLRLQHQILKGKLIISKNEKERIKKEKNSNRNFLDMKYFYNIYEKNLGGKFRDGRPRSGKE